MLAGCAWAHSASFDYISLYNRADSCRAQHNYTCALDNICAALDGCSQEKGENEEYALCLNLKASIFFEMNELDSAEYTYLQALALREQLQGKQHSDYTFTLQCLHTVREQRIINMEADLDYEGALAVRQLYTPDSPECAVLMRKIADKATEDGNFSLAEQYYTRALNLQDSLLGNAHPDYILSLQHLTDLYLAQNNYAAAADQLNNILQLQQYTLGENAPEVAVTWGKMGIVCDEIGNSALAQQCFDSCMQILQDNQQVYDLQFAAVLNDMALVLSKQGKFTDALLLYDRALQVVQTLQGSSHSNYAMILGNKSVIYEALGDYQHQEQCLLTAIDILSATSDNPTGYALNLNNLGTLYLRVGNHSKSEQSFLKALNIQQQTLGEQHVDYAHTLSNLGSLYFGLARYEDAERVLAQARNIYRANGAESNIGYTSVLNSLGLVYSKTDNMTGYVECVQEALGIQQKTIGTNHPMYASSLINLAAAYARMGNFTEAEQSFLQAIDIQLNTIGTNHPDYISSLVNLGVLYANQNRYDQAQDYFFQASVLGRYLFVSTINYLSENQRAGFWSNLKYPFELAYPRFAFRYAAENAQVAQFAYDNILFLKGVLLSASTAVQQSILSSGDEQLIAMWNQLSDKKQFIARERVSNPQSPAIPKYIEQAEQMEKQLLQRSAAFRDGQSRWSISWQDVCRQLKEHDIAIEFMRVPLTSDSIEYCALALRAHEQPQFIRLFSEAELRSVLNLSHKTDIYDYDFGGKPVAELVWNRLLPNMQAGDRIFFSPDGLLYQVAIEYLPLSSDSTIADRYEMHRLSSTRELCLHATQYSTSISSDSAAIPSSDIAHTPSSAILYGGLTYNLTPEQMQSSSREFAQHFSQDLATTGLVNSSLTTSEIAYLSGTLKEVSEISRLFVSAKVYSGAHGNEESFKALSGNFRDILHIGTHGFYLPPSLAEQRAKQNVSFLQMTDMEKDNSFDYSMSRTGLLLAGAQLAWSGQPVPEGAEDGILTAKEIAAIDMNQVHLAVLSACETASGDITGDGVAGLQRGFKQAGVKSLIMSLWPVSDQATQLLMTEFYTNLTSGLPITEALTRARQTVREEFEEPEYWAAFILLDAPN
ncbi:MAG: CHAT domain-containing protein [Bacteroidales bacterium]|nr:CHAT domain-containing protein [Candidatus Colicola coprequi]